MEVFIAFADGSKWCQRRGTRSRGRTEIAAHHRKPRPNPRGPGRVRKLAAVSHTTPRKPSSQHGFGALAGHTSHPVPPVPFLRKLSSKSNRRPAASPWVNGPTEGRISGGRAATSSRNLTAPRLGASVWQVQLNLPLVCLDPRSGRYLGRKATYPSWGGLRYNDLDPERSIAQRYDAVDRLSVRM